MKRPPTNCLAPRLTTRERPASPVAGSFSTPVASEWRNPPIRRANKLGTAETARLQKAAQTPVACEDREVQ